MTRTPAPALSEAEAARVAAFDAAPTPPECNPERVETVARAIYDADAEAYGWVPTYYDRVAHRYRRHAATAISALPPSPAEEAVKRALGVCDELDEELGSYGYAVRNGLVPSPADRIRAALASPAPAPQGDPR